MELNWLESFIFGLISGFTELLPVSAPAHEALSIYFWGVADSPLLRFVVHTAIWEALYLSMQETISKLIKEQKLSKISPRRRPRQPDPVLILEMKLLRSAIPFILMGFLASFFFKDSNLDLSWIAAMLLLNGIILYIPARLPSGNKDSRSMTPMDGVLLGLASAASMLPGLSRLGVVISTAQVRGADKEHALRWALCLDLVAMIFVIIMDVYGIVTYGFGNFSVSTIISCVLAAAGAFCAAMAGVGIMRFLAYRTGFSGFAYYSWGAALFVFLMYLTI